jgi:hypothetical protein
MAPAPASLLWPFQPCPGPNSWRVWRRLLARAFLETVPRRVTPQTKDLHLLQSLGQWLPSADWLFGRWAYRFSMSMGHIYHTVDHHYHVHHRRRRSRQHSQLYYTTYVMCTTSLPSDCIPVEELALSPTILAFRGMHSRRVTTPPTSAPDSFSSYMSALPSWDRPLLQQVEILDAKALIEHLQTDQALFVVSDRGADAECDSYGAVLATADAVLVKTSGSTEGALPGSFRAESYGCIAIFRLLYHFLLYFGLDPILCLNTFYCDNKGLVARHNFATGPLSPFP